MSAASKNEIATVKINNPDGLHLRVASDVVRICQKHDAKVTLSCGDCPEADGCSILSLLLLTAGEGETLTIKAKGNDAKKVIKKISAYFTNGAGI